MLQKLSKVHWVNKNGHLKVPKIQEIIQELENCLGFFVFNWIFPFDILRLWGCWSSKKGGILHDKFFFVEGMMAFDKIKLN
jgi:hypothetical protein